MDLLLCAKQHLVEARLLFAEKTGHDIHWHDVKFSRRMSRTWGYAKWRRMSGGRFEYSITLSAVHLTWDSECLRHVCFHEFAHLAVYQIHGTEAKGHGKEFQFICRLLGIPGGCFIPNELVREARENRK